MFQTACAMNKPFYKALLIAGLTVGMMVGDASATGVEVPNAVRADALIYQLKQDCGSCHGLTLKGGLGPALLPANLVEKDDEILVDTILNGRPGTPMPPWQFEINKSEAQWLVHILKEGLK